MRSRSLLFLLLLGLGLHGQNPLRLDLRPWAQGIGQVVYVTHCGDDRLFAVSQWGGIFIITDSMEVASTPFLDISDRVVNGGERGMLGLAFDPAFADNGHFYVHYMAQGGGYGVSTLSRFTLSTDDPDAADPLSEVVMRTHAQPSPIHQGGHLEFGPDGMLYVALGDGGPGGDPADRAQDPGSPMGKVLRIRPEGDGSYAIPTDNPFVNAGADTLPEIFALGLRNPYRFSIDPLNGDLWLGDVGEMSYEEVDHWPGGSVGAPNFGWRCFEGNAAFLSTGCEGAEAYVPPVSTLAHPNVGGTACAVIGGRVYRGAAYPNFYGHYVFTDLCTGEFRTLEPDGEGGFAEQVALASGNQGFTGIGEGSDGTLYVAHLYEGRVYKLVDRCPMPAPTVTELEGALIASPGPAHQWLSGTDTIPGATEPSYEPPANGWYSVLVDHGDGCVLRSDSVLFLSAGVEALEAGELRIAPQPTAGPVRMYWSGRPYPQEAWVEVSDASGRKVLGLLWPAGRHELWLDVGRLEPATYQVAVFGPNRALVARARSVVLR